MATRQTKTRRKATPKASTEQPPEFLVAGDVDQMVNMTDRANADEDAELVKNTLRDLCRDPATPAAARAQAARTLAEMTGLLGRNAKPVADPSKPVSEMTREELERELAG